MTKCIPYILISVLAVCLIFSLSNKKEVVLETHTVDTVTIVRTDTIIERFPEFVYEKIVDTIFIGEVHGIGLKLPRTQRYYATDLYQAWVSGYEPSLDSLNVFQKTVSNTVTNTVTRNVYPKTFDVYVSLGCFFLDGNASLGLGAHVKFKNDFMLGGNVGYLNKDLFYGLSVGFKINGKNGKHE